MVNCHLNVKFAICIRLIFKAAPFGNTIAVTGKRDIWRNPVKQRGRNDNGCSLNHDLPFIIYWQLSLEAGLLA